MQALDDERGLVVSPTAEDFVGDGATDLAEEHGSTTGEEGGVPVLTESLVHRMLAAVAEMALRSKRQQADLDAALYLADLKVGQSLRLAAVERMRGEGYIDKVVELSDGGVLLSVTAAGLEHLRRALLG